MKYFYIALAILNSVSLNGDDFEDFLENEAYLIEEWMKQSQENIESGLDLTQHYYMIGQHSQTVRILNKYRDFKKKQFHIEP